jgi:hypothetical protein
MTFDEDHWADYADPQLAVHLAHDAEGTPFLCSPARSRTCTGEAFTSAVRMLVEELGVRTTVGMNSIPMAGPAHPPARRHRAPHAPETVAGYERWVGTCRSRPVQGHLLEYRLGQAGLDAAGLRRSRCRTTSPRRSTRPQALSLLGASRCCPA